MKKGAESCDVRIPVPLLQRDQRRTRALADRRASPRHRSPAFTVIEIDNDRTAPEEARRARPLRLDVGAAREAEDVDAFRGAGASLDELGELRHGQGRVLALVAVAVTRQVCLVGSMRPST